MKHMETHAMAIQNGAVPTLVRIAHIPQIVIPEIGVTEGRYGDISFSIPTHRGRIIVRSACGNVWRCQGKAEALAAHGLLELAWLPGLHGNNKSRQTVLFDKDGPRLILGNRRGSKIEGPHIVIILVSKTAFAVEVPTTAEQAEKIRSARTAWHERLRHEDEKYQAGQLEVELQRIQVKRMAASSHEVRGELRQLVNACEGLVVARLESSAYQLDAAADRAIREHLTQLHAWVEKAELHPKTPEKLGENVTRLRPKK